MLDEYDIQMVRKSRRITIPMQDKYVWRSVADALRGLATTLDHYSRLPATEDLTERTMAMNVVYEIARANSIIRDAALQRGIEIKEGRPTTRKPGEHNGHEHETVETLSDRRTPHIGAHR